MNAVERYLLDELSPEQRDEFEEHYFDCPECAEGVRMGTVLIANGRVLERNTQRPSSPGQVVEIKTSPGAVRKSSKFDWMQGLSIAASLVLACVLGYQNLVTIPSLRAPRTISRVLVRPSSRGAGTPVKQAPGAALDLTLEWSGAHSGTAYQAEILTGGHTVTTLSQVTAQEDSIEVLLPEGLAVGDYEILVRSLSPGGDSAEFPIQVLHEAR